MRGFDLNHKSNQFDTPLLLLSEHTELTASFNAFKISLNSLLEIFMRTANCMLRESAKLRQCPLIEGSSKVLEETIRALASMLSRNDILTFPSKFRVIDGIEISLKLLICGLRMTEIYYNLFLNNKRVINEQIIMKCLYLS
jgi:hypothetical protein